MKLEWATVKDDKLVLGSFGKAYTAPGEGGREAGREAGRDGGEEAGRERKGEKNGRMCLA
jgi:hypothetical protein